MVLDGEELIRRFLLHILPKGFMRFRHYGITAFWLIAAGGKSWRRFGNACNQTSLIGNINKAVSIGAFAPKLISEPGETFQPDMLPLLAGLVNRLIL